MNLFNLLQTQKLPFAFSIVVAKKTSTGGGNEKIYEPELWHTAIMPNAWEAEKEPSRLARRAS